MVGQEKWTEGMGGERGGQEKESDTESMEAVRDIRSSGLQRERDPEEKMAYRP